MQTGGAEHFSEFGTLGIEEEFYLVNTAGEPISGTDELVYEADPPEILAGRLDHELFKFVIETQTPTIPDIDDARSMLRTVRRALVEYATDHGYQLAAAGLHPTARWRELEHAEKPRYRAQLDRIQYPQHRNITAGLHIHVGIDDADAAVWIANELRLYLPIMLALSANSPFWYGYDTGLQSARAKIFEGLPNTGIPTQFDSYEEFVEFEQTMVEFDAIADRGELWFDVRPHSDLGTVEVRTPDAQAEERRVLALVEYVYALVLDLAERYNRGESHTNMRRELLDENKWRALRYGREASFIMPGHSRPASLPELVSAESDRLEVAAIDRLLAWEGGAARQRRLYREGGFSAVLDSLRVE